jgi:hypothetical protein
VPEQKPYVGQRPAAIDGRGGEAVAQVVDAPPAFQSRGFHDGPPLPLEAREVAGGGLARKDEGAGPGQPHDQIERLLGEIQVFESCFVVKKYSFFAFKLYIRLF